MTVPGKRRAVRAQDAPAVGIGGVAARPATELAVPVGAQVIDVLELAYRARRPVLLEGPTGIGKSQIVAEFARATGLSFVVLDLSLLEPPDLIGLPQIEDGRTHYASPAELPTSGRGVLMLEELNRAEIPVMQPALQLLSARRLHAYELPAGWICVAAINPEDGDYQVNRLDPALRSRFLQLSICADRDLWVDWAKQTNVHPVIVRVVETYPDAFEQASPRSWTYASDLLHALRPEDFNRRELVRLVLRGYLPPAWALIVADALTKQRTIPALDASMVFSPSGAASVERLVNKLEDAQQIDAIAMVAARLRYLLASDELVARVEAAEVSLASLETLLAPLPGDLREQCLESATSGPAAGALLRGLGFDATVVARAYRGSPLASQLQTWRAELLVYKIRLVVAAVFRELNKERLDEQTLAALTPHVGALVADAGPVAADLGRWLRARVPQWNP